ncbi:hypothetical protein U2T78_004372 [Providencia stuartii]|uniref:hypothetical protein n=1 Tax=Providencia stuartii TaxID=588 RepID=UPI0024AC588D|nr:hypothetical protein [Providencia stuartii]EMA3643552.1 hypothetical protein [Providencia stuartii]MBW3103418.1 hypothetical protein [Providencia stuartii]MCB5219900.1 hypothetical protein [Providencia stuartii]MEB3135114.1 hypothetical protein [Providencia stuartii]
MNIGIAELIAKNFKVGDIVHSSMLRDISNSKRHVNCYSVVLRELADAGVLKKLKMSGRNMEYRVIADVNIAIDAEIKRRKEPRKIGVVITPFANAFPNHLMQKFNESIARVRA